MCESLGLKMDLKYIAEENSFEILEVTSLGGGDINQVFLITTTGAGKFVVKLNSSEKYPGMFQAEKEGLEELSASKTFKIPAVINNGKIDGNSYLLLEYLESGTPGGSFWENFGEKLASLHKKTASQFGFHNDNYIGSLPQKNSRTSGAAEFYVNQRLIPQLQLAREQNFELSTSDHFLRNIADNIPNEPPSLVHGDLWSGNYIATTEGTPALIDPAVAYAPREMDLAMMKLFGGFNRKVFQIYEEEFPLEKGFEDRVQLWQLYYLLVHLNIFGKGYRNQVMNIIRQYN